jgi:hypothetical protein
MTIDELNTLLNIYSTTDPIAGRAFRQNTTEAARLKQIQVFNDVIVTVTYLNQGTADERINTVVYSSVASNLASVTLTMGYVGSSGSYSLSTVTYS